MKNHEEIIHLQNDPIKRIAALLSEKQANKSSKIMLKQANEINSNDLKGYCNAIMSSVIDKLYHCNLNCKYSD